MPFVIPSLQALDEVLCLFPNELVHIHKVAKQRLGNKMSVLRLGSVDMKAGGHTVEDKLKLDIVKKRLNDEAKMTDDEVRGLISLTRPEVFSCFTHLFSFARERLRSRRRKRCCIEAV